MEHTQEEREKATKLAREFAKEHKIYDPPNRSACSISEVGINDPNDKDNRNLCIVVLLKKKLPKRISLPSEYKGMKVFYKVIGVIRPS